MLRICCIQSLQQCRIRTQGILLPSVIHKAKYVIAGLQRYFDFISVFLFFLSGNKIIIEQYTVLSGSHCHLEPASSADLLAGNAVDCQHILSRLRRCHMKPKLTALLPDRRGSGTGTVKGSDTGHTILFLLCTFSLQNAVLHRRELCAEVLPRDTNASDIRCVHIFCIGRFGKGCIVPEVITVVHLQEVHPPIQIGLCIHILVTAGSHRSPGTQIGADIIVHTELQTPGMNVIGKRTEIIRKFACLVRQFTVYSFRLVTAVIQYHILIAQFVQSQFHHGVCHCLGQRLRIAAAEGIPAVPSHGRQPALFLLQQYPAIAKGIKAILFVLQVFGSVVTIFSHSNLPVSNIFQKQICRIFHTTQDKLYHTLYHCKVIVDHMLVLCGNIGTIYRHITAQELFFRRKGQLISLGGRQSREFLIIFPKGYIEG